MIGDFSSAIDRIEYLQNQNIAKTDRSSLLGIFIKSSLLSGKGISKEEIQKKFSYISFKDEAEKDEALQKHWLSMTFLWTNNRMIILIM